MFHQGNEVFYERKEKSDLAVLLGYSGSYKGLTFLGLGLSAVARKSGRTLRKRKQPFQTHDAAAERQHRMEYMTVSSGLKLTTNLHIKNEFAPVLQMRDRGMSYSLSCQ